MLTLTSEDLADTELRGVDFSYTDLQKTDLSRANLENAQFWRARLDSARLLHANLMNAKLGCATLADTHLQGANLYKARLDGAELLRTWLHGTDLRETSLRGASLRYVMVDRTDLTGAQFSGTVVATDLSGFVGLDTVQHNGSSIIHIDSILRLGQELPENFLRGCGFRDEEIAYFRSKAPMSESFYSCFLSYSSEDETFATRLHNDFQNAGIRCWKWDHDAKTGEGLWSEIDQAIRSHDKLVLVASEGALKSPAVNREIERAIAQEDTRLKDDPRHGGTVNVLFPVRLDDYIFNGWHHERKNDVTKKVIADARHWRDPAVYSAIVDRLIRDLKNS